MASKPKTPSKPSTPSKPGKGSMPIMPTKGDGGRTRPQPKAY